MHLTDIQGRIVFTANLDYWSSAAFKHGFQNAISFFQLGGTDVNVYGGGTLDGNGGAWGSKSKRPILFAIVGMKGGVIADLNLKDSPQWFNIIKDSQDVVYSNLNIHGKQHNTDGWDTLRSNNIVIQNSRIENGDDCVSFKPGSINIIVQNLACSGSHGISVGSLGQYKGEVDIVENVYVYNISMSNASNGARIKTWAGHGNMNGVGSGGGGSGRVNNVTFEKFRVSGVESAIMITQCYGEKDAAKCRADPSKVSISNIVIKDFTGSAKGKNGAIGSIECASPSLCKNISLQDIRVGGGRVTCSNVKVSGC
jgi:galacturan 1,4-alpha-galacturonidase